MLFRSQRESLLAVQLCVRDSAGLTQLLSDFRDFAAERHMLYIDDSAGQLQDRRAAGVQDAARADGSPVLYVEVRNEQGIGFVAFNNGLPGYQVALGFMAGSNRPAAAQLAEEVVSRLSRRWQVVRLPAGSSAIPMTSCK